MPLGRQVAAKAMYAWIRIRRLHTFWQMCHEKDSPDEQRQRRTVSIQGVLDTPHSMSTRTPSILLREDYLFRSCLIKTLLKCRGSEEGPRLTDIANEPPEPFDLHPHGSSPDLTASHFRS